MSGYGTSAAGEPKLANRIAIAVWFSGRIDGGCRACESPALCRPELAVMSALGGILLQKSFEDDERNFLGPLMRFVRKDVRDLIAHQKNGDGASYRRHGVL